MMKYLTGLLILINFSVIFAENLPNNSVWFHPNRGQWHENIDYQVDLINGKFYIENTGFTFLFHDAFHHHPEDKVKQNPSDLVHVVKANFINANPNNSISEEGKSTFFNNYFLGNDESKWKSEIYSVNRIVKKEFYPNVDFVLEAGINKVKYFFDVKNSASTEQIKLKFEGAKKIKINKDGSLTIYHSYGEIHDKEPVAWTLSADGKRKFVKIRYKLENNIVSFQLLENINPNERLIIDPEMTFSTYTGSSSDNWGCSATPDDAGNLFAAGTVFGTGYPTTAGTISTAFLGGDAVGYGAFDVSLTKFNATGTQLIYSTYIGGNGNEAPSSMICTTNGELYMLGSTSSNDFPTPNGFSTVHGGGNLVNLESSQGMLKVDAFIIRINAAGTAILNGTFLGGAGNDGINEGTSGSAGDLVFNYGDNFRGEITLDANNNVYVTGTTKSLNFPRVNAFQNNINGAQDAFVSKFNANLTNLLWSTYYGGSGLECGNSIQVSSTNEVYVVGGTTSSNLQVIGGVQNSFGGGSADGFLARFNGTSGALISSTYIGTSGYDQAFFVQIDITDNVFVYGQTDGPMLTSPGIYNNANGPMFIRKFTPDLASITYTSRFGTLGNRISPTAFLVSNCNEIYIAGWGGSILGTDISNFQVTPDAFQANSGGGDAFYLALFAEDMASITYATFLGGSSDEHVDGGTSRFDKNGKVYHAVCASCGNGNNGFFSTPGVYSPTNGSNNCNLAAFKFELSSINALVSETDFYICIPQPVQFFGNSQEGDTYLWRFGDGDVSTDQNPSHVYQNEGVYNVTFIVSDSRNCLAPDSTTFEVTVGSFEAGIVDPTPTICKGQPYQLNASGGLNYTWSPANVLDNPNIPNPIATIFQTTNFSVIIADTCGVDTVQVTLQVFDDEISVSPDTSMCLGIPISLEVLGAVSQVWSPNNFINNANSSTPIVDPIASQYYYVDATTANNCQFRDSVFVDVFFDPPNPQIDDTTTMCYGRPQTINVSGASTYTWSPNQFISPSTGPTITVNPPSSRLYYCFFENACGVDLDSIYVQVLRAQINAFNDTTICRGDTIMLRASGGIQYLWSPATYLNETFNDTVYAAPLANIEYQIIGIDQNACVDTAYLQIALFPTNQVSLGPTIFAEVGEILTLVAETNANGNFYWTPTTDLTCPTCKITQAFPNRNIQYTVYFEDENGCFTNDNITINYAGILYVPNTFTPDGNIKNPVFKAYGEGIVSFRMDIYNRWGELIKTLYHIDESWDGTYKGKICQDGTYTWKIVYDDGREANQRITGHVNILK